MPTSSSVSASPADALMKTVVSPLVVVPGAFYFPRYLDLRRQRALVDECRALLDGATPAYVPVVRGGGKMHVRMLCLGRHWNGTTYRYEPTRSDFDQRQVPPLPEFLGDLARELAAA